MLTTILSSEDIGTVVVRLGLDALMDEVIDELTEACRRFDADAFCVPARSGFHYSNPHTGLIEWMPALARGDSATVKLVAYHPDNPAARDLPTILSSLYRFDTRSGHLSAIVDGTFLTAIRTGAASAIASRILAVPESTTLGLIGCGAQAVAQLHALSRVFRLERVLFFDTDGDAVAGFERRSRQLGLSNVRFEAGAADTIACEADILCTCTSIEIGDGPVFNDGSLKPWLHINAVGSDFPGKVELPRTVLARGFVVPDFRAQSLEEGECQQLREDEIGPELAALVRDAGEYYEFQRSLTVFDSTGWSVEDHVAADILLRHARRLGVGTEIQVESVSADPKDPYGFILDSSRQPRRKLVAVD